MDRKTLLAVVLCFLIFMGWQKLYIEPRMQQAPLTTQQSANSSNIGAALQFTAPPTLANSSGAAVPGTQKPVLLESKPVNLSTGVAQVGNGAQIFTGWNLKSYKVGIAPEAAAVDLANVTQQPAEVELAFDLPEYSYLTNVQGSLTQTPKGVVWNYEDANVKLVRETTGSEDQSYVDLKITADFKTKKPGFAFISMLSQSAEKDPEARDRQLVYWTNQAVERQQIKEDVPQKEVATPVKWIGATNRYFLFSLVAGEGFEPKALIQKVAPYVGRISMVYPMSGNSITLPLKAFFGPKELELLRSVEPTLDHTVDFGMFTIFAYPLLKVMKAIYSFSHNYGVAIILLTLLVKLLTFPLTYKSMKSMKEMAKLQPQLQRVREKHKDDKEALNREMLTMMKSHGYNPAAGCLPVLIQMPIFFALYRVLYSSIELYHAPFLLWIHDLSAHDPFYVTPVLMTITMFVQQKLTPNTATDPAQAKMMQFMPVIFGVFMISLPAGLTLYMWVNALASIAQQMILNKKLDSGQVPAIAARAR